MESVGKSSDITARRVELKFSIDNAQSLAISQWAREKMQRDENVAQGSDDTYQITSLYLDTPNFDIYRRNEVVSKRKHRLRRYDNDRGVWLETKFKSKNIVNKRRTLFAGDNVADLFAEDALNALNSNQIELEAHADARDDRSAVWFQRRVHKLRLRPASYVSYDRFARVAFESGQAFRLTIDSNIASARAHDWVVPWRPDTLQALTDQQILELKFENTLPPLFNQLMSEFSFSTNKFSKYRSSVSAFYESATLGLVA